MPAQRSRASECLDPLAALALASWSPSEFARLDTPFGAR